MKGEVGMNPCHLNMLVGGVWEGTELVLVGGRGQVPIETSRAIPTHGGASRADFAKVIPRQEGAGKMPPLGTGGAF